MIKIAIVEDDKMYAERLVKYIERYEEQSGQKFVVEHFKDGADIVEEYGANHDIILMDIEMTFMDGMTAAEKIRKVDSEVVIIFITNMAQYAMKGYAVEALDYVLKPINYYAFSQRLDRALTRMKHRTKQYLPIAYKGEVTKLDISTISYIEVRDHDLLYHTKTETHLSRATMRETEEKLQGKGFFRCNKCYLVNLEHVESCKENTVLVRGEKIPVSRARKKELLDALNDYMNEVSK